MQRRTRLVVLGIITAALAVAVPPPQKAARVNVTLHKAEAAFAGLTTEILGVQAGGVLENPRFRVFDMNGRVVNTWNPPLPGWFFGLVKPLPGGSILAILNEYGSGRRVMIEMDWDGAVKWVFDPGAFGVRVHHDFQRLPNGNTLLLTQVGRNVPWLRPGTTVDDILVEIDRNGTIVWAWSTLDSAAKLPFTAAEWTYLSTLSGTTLFHTNSVQALPPNRWEEKDPRFRAGNLILSQRDTNLVFIIDKPTGDVVWSYRGAIGQHHARMLTSELPGAGNILIFDNGGSGGTPPITRQYSRVIELHPPSSAVVWSYSCIKGACRAGKGTTTFYSPFLSGAQRLPNGNTLITEGTMGRLFEVTPGGTLTWEYLIATSELQIYRGYRLDRDWRSSESGEFIW